MTDERRERARDVILEIGNALGYPMGWKKALAERVGVYPTDISKTLGAKASPATIEALQLSLGIPDDYFDFDQVPVSWRTLADKSSVRELEEWAARTFGPEAASSSREATAEAFNAVASSAKRSAKRTKKRRAKPTEDDPVRSSSSSKVELGELVRDEPDVEQAERQEAPSLHRAAAAMCEALEPFGVAERNRILRAVQILLGLA